MAVAGDASRVGILGEFVYECLFAPPDDLSRPVSPRSHLPDSLQSSKSRVTSFPFLFVFFSPRDSTISSANDGSKQ